MEGFLKEVTEKGFIRKTSTVIPFGSIENIPAESDIVKKLLQNEDGDDDQDFNRESGMDGKICDIIIIFQISCDVTHCTHFSRAVYTSVTK